MIALSGFNTIFNNLVAAYIYAEYLMQNYDINVLILYLKLMKNLASRTVLIRSNDASW